MPFTFAELRKHFLSLSGAWEDLPFDFVTPVYKVGNKMFGLLSTEENPPRVNLKCDPALALMLRERYPAVLPGYHMNKQHWNTVIVDGSIPDDDIRKMVEHSYELVYKSLTKLEKSKIMIKGYNNGTDG